MTFARQIRARSARQETFESQIWPRRVVASQLSSSPSRDFCLTLPFFFVECPFFFFFLLAEIGRVLRTRPWGGQQAANSLLISDFHFPVSSAELSQPFEKAEPLSAQCLAAGWC